MGRSKRRVSYAGCDTYFGASVVSSSSEYCEAQCCVVHREKKAALISRNSSSLGCMSRSAGFLSGGDS